MALVPATLKVNFAAIYVLGCHRICYSTNPLGPFDTCLEETFSAGPSTFEVPVMVDPESCDPVNYYGYIQACCEDAESENGRVNWTATYTPTPLCTAVKVKAIGSPTVAMTAPNMCTNPGEFNAKAPGTEFYVCYEGGITGANFITDDTGPTGWTARGFTATDSTDVCCANCCTYEVDCGLGATYQYINCSGNIITAIGSGTELICAKQGSVSPDAGSTIIITQINTVCTLP